MNYPKNSERFVLWLPLVAFLLGNPASVLATEQSDSREQMELEQLLDIGFEELAQITLTTAARKEQKLIDTAGAVYVIDQEEIRRSGMTSIPELLRLVPGLEVARINNNVWAITARGFNAQYSNKLLVLMDGRTLYNPLFTGVHWDVQDTMLDNIERIEVIRGPGGSLWGANAVNGVINIITKSAADTKGGRISIAAGNNEKIMGEARYGHAIGANSAIRYYAKGFDRRSYELAAGGDSGENWNSQQGGFRADLNLSEQNNLTIQGDIYNVEKDTTDTKSNGGNIMMRFNRAISEDSDLSLQLYYDRTKRTDNEERDTFDADFQHRFSPMDDNELIWGLGYRATMDDMANSLVIWSPQSATDETYSFFIQDEISAMEDQVRFTIGTKVEKNDYTGWEYQPSARAFWRINPKHSAWASVSRAVRTPSRVDRDFYISVSTGAASVLTISGDKTVESEDLTAYEAGYRGQPSEKLFFDIAAFYNRYDDLVSYETGTTVAGGIVTVAQVFDNQASAATYGVETAMDWQVKENWKLRASHTYLKMVMELDSGSTDTTISASDGDIPRHQFQIRSYLDLRDDLELDGSLFYVDRIKNASIPAYTRLDMRLGWRPTADMTVSLAGHNLLDDEHKEFTGASSGTTSSVVPRTFLARIDWEF